MTVTRFDRLGRLDARKRTPQGGLRVDANLTRTGIFVYDGPNGQVREYRPPEEVFHEDSLATLALAPLVVGHPDMVGPENYRTHTIGTVAENVRKRDTFVAADVVVQDRKTVDQVEQGVLCELSCGYTTDLEASPGITPEGEHYDAVQRNIRYNHVGIGPKNWGRAGGEVRLRLDGNGNAVLEDATNVPDNRIAETSSSYTEGMTLEELQKKYDIVTAERDALKAEALVSVGKVSDLEKVNSTLKADQSVKIDRKDIPALVAARNDLESRARRVLGPDAKFIKADGTYMSDNEIVADTLVKHDAAFKFDGRSEDYLRARFDHVTEQTAKVDAAHQAAGDAVTQAVTNGGTPAKSLIDSAQERADAEAQAASKAGPPAGALLRK